MHKIPYCCQIHVDGFTCLKSFARNFLYCGRPFFPSYSFSKSLRFSRRLWNLQRKISFSLPLPFCTIIVVMCILDYFLQCSYFPNYNYLDIEQNFNITFPNALSFMILRFLKTDWKFSLYFAINFSISFSKLFYLFCS